MSDTGVPRPRLNGHLHVRRDTPAVVESFEVDGRGRHSVAIGDLALHGTDMSHDEFAAWFEAVAADLRRVGAAFARRHRRGVYSNPAVEAWESGKVDALMGDLARLTGEDGSAVA